MGSQPAAGGFQMTTFILLICIYGRILYVMTCPLYRPKGLFHRGVKANRQTDRQRQNTFVGDHTYSYNVISITCRHNQWRMHLQILPDTQPHKREVVYIHNFITIIRRVNQPRAKHNHTVQQRPLMLTAVPFWEEDEWLSIWSYSWLDILW